MTDKSLIISQNRPDPGIEGSISLQDQRYIRLLVFTFMERLPGPAYEFPGVNGSPGT